VWFNGGVKHTLLGDKVVKGPGYTPINLFGGSAHDGKSWIWPAKAYRGLQPYDPVNQTLIVPHTYGTDPDVHSVNFNWEKALRPGWPAPAHRSPARWISSRPRCCGGSSSCSLPTPLWDAGLHGMPQEEWQFVGRPDEVCAWPEEETPVQARWVRISSVFEPRSKERNAI
jgi:hypothetical protein